MPQMERFFSPGYKVKPKEEAKRKGRPPVMAAEGALDLGEKRPRDCASRKKEFDEEAIRELRRRVGVLETLSSAASTDDKLQKILRLHDQADEEIRELRRLLQKKKSR